LRILSANQCFYSSFQVLPENTVGNFICDLGAKQWDIPKLRLLLEDVLPKASVFNGYEVEHEFPGIGRRTMLLNAREIFRQDVGSKIILLALEDITERKAAQEQVERLAFFDPLTGLANRRLMLDRLQQALSSSVRNKKHCALLLLDLDNFKTINDTLGHKQGDLLLQEVAARLKACVRDGDTVARLGGDEFIVILEDLGENTLHAATQAAMVGEKILVRLRHVYEIGDLKHSCSASIGITLFGEQVETADELLIRADLAMYRAKDAGRNTLCFFDPRMQTELSTRLVMEEDLREAVEQRQFSVYYQAQVNSQGRITGVEALLRWQHSTRGWVSPVEFIPMAEKSGLILPLGLWVLETACAQLALWAARPETAQQQLAVNVSARQFRDSDFVDQVLAIVKSSGANAKLLKLELTESVLAANVEDVVSKMNSLKAAGIGFSLDDFGTGYSSLSLIKRLPLDYLKIDQSFVRNILLDPDDAAIAKMVIVLAHTMGVQVMAEGVESVEQRDLLASLGCQNFQGYLFSRPLPIQELEALLAKA
jgi:diguanylate cyclase (GGDEF)-like protein